jgi:hypothetical protein
MTLKGVVTSLCRDLAQGDLDGWKEGELQHFLERLFDFGASQHVAVQIPGMKSVRRFKARISDRGVVVRKDNSHPNSLEFEFNVPTPVRNLAAHIEKQTFVLTGFTQQIETHLSVLRGINHAVNGLTRATKDFKNVFSREHTIDYENASEPPDSANLHRLPWTEYHKGGGQWIFSDLPNPVAQQLRAYLESVKRRVEIGAWNYRICGKADDPHAFIARNPIPGSSRRDPSPEW